METKNFLIDSEMPWQNVGGGLSRKILGYDENIMNVAVKFEKGGIGSMHTHPHTQSSYIVSGKFELNIAGEKKVLTAGDAYFVPSNVEHECICLEAGILIDSFAPYRADFLK